MRSLCELCYASTWIWMLNCQVIFDPHPSRYYSENDCQGGIAQSQYEVSWVPIWGQASTLMEQLLDAEKHKGGQVRPHDGLESGRLQSHIVVEYILYGSIAKD